MERRAPLTCLPGKGRGQVGKAEVDVADVYHLGLGLRRRSERAYAGSAAAFTTGNGRSRSVRNNSAVTASDAAARISATP